MNSDSNQVIDRRRFISSVGSAVVAAPFLNACSVAGPDRVAIVGAGLAGLSAAHELRKAGVEFDLFEQSTRPGGRVWTIRDGLAEGVAVDAGAMGGASSYTNWLAYCNEFNIPMKPPAESQQRPGALLHLKGDFYHSADLKADPGLWPIDLHEHEKDRAPFGLLSAHLMPLAKEIGATENVLDAAYQRYDELSLLDFLREQNASEAAIALIEHTLNYNSLATISTLSALRDITRRLVGAGSSANIDGGQSLLPEAMASGLQNDLHYRRTLTAISTIDGGVRLHLQSPSGAETYEAARVILAIPFTALRDVRIDPPLPVERQQMIEELPYTQIAKTFVQTRTRFWEGQQDFSLMHTDSPFERVFALSADMPEQKGLLMNWINGVGLAPFSKLPQEQYEQSVVQWMQEIWPDHADQFEEALTIDWSHTYAGGAYSHYAPGQLQKFAREIPKPIGNLHFAGEHTELVAPGLEGAVTSGIRTATEVLHALQ